MTALSPRRAAPGAPRRTRGVTMVELVTAISIVGIMASLAFPSFATFLAGQRLRAASTDLMSSLLLARSEAIKRNAQVRVAPASADWTQGWRVVALNANEQVDAKNPLGQRVEVVGAPAEIVFERNGRLAVAGVTRLEFRDAGGRAASRCLAIEPGGVPKLSVVQSGGC